MIVDGKKLAIEIQENLKEKISSHKQVLRLAIVYVGENTAIEQFIKIKKKFGESIGVKVSIHKFTENISENDLVGEIKSLTEDKSITGVIVQLPLPQHIDAKSVLNSIPAGKDVDVLSRATATKFTNRETELMPPVAGAVKHILDTYKVELEHKNIVIIGKGRLVGEPVSQLFNRLGVTHTTLDENTKDNKTAIADADIIISGVGNPGFIAPEMVKDGVVLIDAGTSESEGKLVGDIDPACAEKASIFTPVPGGVGPLTVAVVFENLVHLVYANN